MTYFDMRKILLLCAVTFGLAIGTANASSGECKPEEMDRYALIDGYLNDAFRGEHVGFNSSVSDRIGVARAKALNGREDYSDQAEKIARRDALYFLHGMYAATNSDLEAAFWIRTFPEAYDAVKWAAHSLRDRGYGGLEWLLRADKHIPTTPPGGAEWARRGLEVGAKIPSETVHIGSDNHGLNLECPEAKKQEPKRTTSPAPRSSGGGDDPSLGYRGPSVDNQVRGICRANPWACGGEVPTGTVEVIDQLEAARNYKSELWTNPPPTSRH